MPFSKLYCTHINIETKWSLRCVYWDKECHISYCLSSLFISIRQTWYFLFLPSASVLLVCLLVLDHLVDYLGASRQLSLFPEGICRILKLWEAKLHQFFHDINRQISLHVQRHIRVDVGHVFGTKTNPYLKIKYAFESFHQPAIKL